VANGDGGDFEHYVRMPDGTWKRFAEFNHRVIRTRFGMTETLYGGGRRRLTLNGRPSALLPA